MGRCGKHAHRIRLADAIFLSDGRIALSIALPERQSIGTTGSWREAWLLDPSTAGCHVGAIIHEA
jgi:hypothetical protein